jgi:hypothetical protein
VLGVGRIDSERTRRLIQAAAEAGAERNGGREFSDEECDQRSRHSIRLNLKRFLRTGYRGPLWFPEQLHLLGTMLDGVMSMKVGRSLYAVRVMRTRLGIPNLASRSGAQGSPRWSAKEDDLFRWLSPTEAARRTGRTLCAVHHHRSLLGLKGFRSEARIR